MFTPDQYELLAYGQGRKWENFGGVIVERETASISSSIPVTRVSKQDNQANLIFRLDQHENQKGKWFPNKLNSALGIDGILELANPRGIHWKIRHRDKVFQLKPTPAGQVGLFPEQAMIWEWIEFIPGSLKGLKGINLFGYTGGTTLALASRGVEMVHIDAADNVVKWARQNAALSGLEQASIRWIAEDAVRFVSREIKRGSRYDVIVLDPPSYGRGPKGEQWKIEDHLESLLEMLAELCGDRLKLLVLSCHTPGFEANVLRHHAESIFDFSAGDAEAMPMELAAGNQRSIQAGHCIRFIRRDLNHDH